MLPPVIERLGARVREIKNSIAFHFDPRASVYGETLQQVGVIKKLEGLLGGEQRKVFVLEASIYTGLVWGTGPARIEVAKRPNGFDLIVQTAIIGNPPDSYGHQMEIRGGTVEFFELPRGGGRKPWPAPTPWDAAQAMVDRVVMATSNDPAVQRQYKAMRAEENRRAK